MEFNDTFEDEAVVTDADLANVAALAQLQLEREREVAHIEDDLKRAKAQLRKVQEVDLPELMAELGLSQFTLRTGEQVSVDENMYASIAKKNKRAAAQWFVDNGQGSLVRNEVSLTFGAGEYEKVKALREVLDSAGFREYAVSESVNTASAKAAIKELLANGVDVPLDLFGVHFQKQAKITV